MREYTGGKQHDTVLLFMKVEGEKVIRKDAWPGVKLDLAVADAFITLKEGKVVAIGGFSILNLQGLPTMADVFLLCSFDIVFNPPQNLTGTGPSIGSVDPVPMRGIFSSTQSFCLKVSEWFIWSATTGKGLPNAFSTSSRKKRGRQRILAHRSSEEISRSTR